MPKWLQQKEKTPKVIIPEAKPIIILVLGGPGSGKGTMGDRVAEEFKYVHLSIGDLLREEAANPDSDLAAMINEHVMQGAVVPAEVTVNVLMNALRRHEDWKHSKFIIDGFPRNVTQMEAFNTLIGDKVVLKACLFFDCAERNMKKRLLAHADSEHARDDDTVDIIEKRIANFKNDAPLLQRYFQYEGLLERIDANREIEKVWVDVQQYFCVQGYHDIRGEGGGSSPIKAIWKLRDKQAEEIFPTGHSHTSTSSVKGPHARNFSSYTILARHRDKHTRNMRCPMDQFAEPMTMSHEIGWQGVIDGQQIGTKGTPRGSTTPRCFYPKNTCSMTRHMENMYSTNAQHIIRRW